MISSSESEELESIKYVGKQRQRGSRPVQLGSQIYTDDDDDDGDDDEEDNAPSGSSNGPDIVIDSMINEVQQSSHLIEFDVDFVPQLLA
jgi:hypothetical protein